MVDVSGSYPELQPVQQVEEYTDEWYIKNMRFITAQYNRSLNNIPIMTGGSVAFNGTSTYIQEYYNNIQYKYGSQSPADYAFFIKDYSGNNTQVPMTRGLDIMKITNFLQGETIKMTAPMPKTVVAKAHSSGALSAKKNALDYVYFQLKNKTFIDAIELESGIGFKAVDRDFQTQDQVDKFFEDFEDGMEKAYNYMAKDVFYSNDCDILWPKAADYIMYGNLGSMCVEYKNGKPRLRLIPCDRAIVDYEQGLDVHIKDNYGGEVDYMELTELSNAYDWTAAEIADLTSMSSNISGHYSNYFTPMANGLSWFTYNNNVRKVLVVKGQWKSQEKDEFGNWQIVRREADFIGNKYLRNQRVSPGDIYRKGDKCNKQLKYIQFTPGLLLGTSVSIVSTAKRYQDIKDAFITKAISMAAKAMGKGVIINIAKLPIGMATPEFISQMKQAGVVLVEGADIDDKEDGKRMVEAYDLSLDPGIKDILAMAQYFQQEIADFTDTSPIVRGQQDTYQSNGVVNNIQAQSAKGRAFYFEGFKLWVREIVSYACKEYKALAPNDELGRENLSLEIGDALTELLSMDTVREMQFEDFNISLEVDNFMDEIGKEKLINLTVQTAGNPQGRKALKDYVKLSRLGTLTEMEDYLDAEIFKDEQREAQNMEADRQAAEKNASINSNAQIQMTDMQMKLAAQADETKRLAIASKEGIEKQSAQLQLVLDKVNVQSEHIMQDKQIEADLIMQQRDIDADKEQAKIDAKKPKPTVKK